MGLVEAADELSRAGKAGMTAGRQRGKIVQLRDAGDRGRVVDKNSIGQGQYHEDRTGSPDDTPEDHATLLGIADH